MTVRQADPYGRGSYCIVVALHGTDSEEAEVLRTFRDRYLSRMPFGNPLIDLYYRASPAITRLLGNHSGIMRISAVAVSGIARIVPR